MNNTDKTLIEKIRSKYDNHPLQGKEYMNRAYWLAFYNGHHYVNINRDRIQEIQESDSEFKHRSKINHIKKNALISVSKMVKEQPTVLGIPTGDQNADARAARAATQLLKHSFDHNERNLTADLYAVLLNAYIYGTGYWYIRWNPNLYVTVGSGGQQAMKGDWECTVLDDFDVLPDPTQKRFDRLKYMMYSPQSDYH